MRYDYIDPLVRTAQEVLNCTLNQRISAGNLAVLEGEGIYGDVVVVVRIAGDAEGDLLLTMDDATALRVCAALLHAEFDALTPEAMDALGELGNMIAGNAVSALNDLGFDFSIRPPEVRVRACVASDLGGREGLRIPLLSACGQVDASFFLGAE